MTCSSKDRDALLRSIRVMLSRTPKERSNVLDLVTIEFAAEYLHVSTRTVRNYIADGLIEAKHIGPRMIRIDYEILRTFGRPIHKRRF
jgi:excisionase family DNA binding protein